MKCLALLSALGYFAAASVASAQIQVSAQATHTNFLLYERVDLIVTIQNMGDSQLLLDNNEGHPWLSFLVSRHNRLPVRQERQSNFAALTLKVGETKTLRVNITPLFSFREEGDYKVEAVVDLPGQGQILSDPVPFVVMKGTVVWSQLKPVETSQRVYSLIRFSPDSDTTRLYLRVENPSENIVYTNISLGNMASYMDPMVYFDPKNNIHVLHPVALGTYLYSRADEDGKVEDQTIFKTFREIPPRLAKLDDGTVIVAGGLAEDPNKPREKLSEGQTSKSAAAEPAPPVPTGPSEGLPGDAPVAQPVASGR